MYIYPNHLKSKAMLWLWELRDLAIIGVGAFLSIRMEDTSILDFLRYAARYFILGQQTYAWGIGGNAQ